MMTERSRGSVVDITTFRGGGSGWIYRVDQNGKAWILTNEHVVESARTVTVRFEGSGRSRTGTVVGTDARRDIAVVTICCDRNWRPLPIAESHIVQAGSDVVILGYPEGRLGSGISVTTGIVSSFDYSTSDKAWLVQTDAAVNSGNSGGPMLNQDGEVIGIVSSRRDPSTAENIGFAIAMQTVNEQLQRLESGTSVAAPTPTPRPTITPTPGSSSGVSGNFAYNPSTGKIACADSRYARTVVSDSTIDSAAFLRFELPRVREWSIGFIYHAPNEGDDTDTATFIYGNSRNEVYARHWVRRNGTMLHDIYSDENYFSDLRAGAGQKNELVFRTSSDGTILRLNDKIVLEVPGTNLRRIRGWSQVCVGFHFDEATAYSIDYSDLRTRFTREGVSGSLKTAAMDDDLIGCANFSFENSLFSDDAIDSWVLLDFGVPRASKWSLGFQYHAVNEGSSRAVVIITDGGDVTVHTSGLTGDFSHRTLGFIRVGLLKIGPGNPNILEFETTMDGSWLRLNGEKVLDVPVTEQFRRRGISRLCVRWVADETSPYTVPYSNLWAWTQ